MFAVCVAGCGSGGGSDASAPQPLSTREILALPSHFAEPSIPDYNPLTQEKVALGRRLFYDERLSGNETQSCSTCHLQERAFSDGRETSIGSTGEPHPRNSQGLANVAYFATKTWGNNALIELEDQIRVPILSDAPVELGVSDGNVAIVLARFQSDAEYRRLFAAAFPQEGETITINKIVFALASFCRAMISGDSPYDRYLQGDSTALSEQQIRGLRLFNSEKFECFHCHNGVNFSISYRDARTTPGTATYPFFNNGLYNVGGDGSYPAGNQGVYELTQDPRDRGRFRPQGLRNVAVTAPYMHDGSIASLRDVIAHYARGGRLIESGPYAGDGRRNPYKSSLVSGFTPTESEIEDLLAFFDSLTDYAFLENPRLADPDRVGD